MSFKLVAQVMDIKVGSPLRKIILIKLADQANDEGVCWPSYESIAKTCEISKRSVITHIQKLEKQGFLRIEKRYNKDAGKNFSNKYHLTLSKGSANDSPLEGGANAALVQMSV
ncbi:helix-turn-helix domain-containing protein, partial [Psychrobacter sp.]